MNTRINTLITSLVAQHIDNPTREMTVAFRSLPAAHKWLLYALLEAGDRPSYLSNAKDLKVLESRFDVLCPADEHRSFNAVLEETSEAFVQIVRFRDVSVGVTWIHPSCQDLTIEELANSTKDRRRFMSLCTLDGIEKALSVAGGSKGKRILPLLITNEDWHCLMTRCSSMINDNKPVIDLLLRNLASLELAIADAESSKLKKLTEMIVALWPQYSDSVQRKPNWSRWRLSEFFTIRKLTGSSTKPNRLYSAWKSTVESVLSAMDEDVAIADADIALKNFLGVAKLLIEHEPYFWAVSSTQTLYRKALNAIQERTLSEMEIRQDWFDCDSDTLDRIADECSELADLFGELSRLPNIDEQTVSVLEDADIHFNSQCDHLRERAAEKSPPEDTDDSVMIEAAVIENQSVTLEQLFADL